MSRTPLASSLQRRSDCTTYSASVSPPILSSEFVMQTDEAAVSVCYMPKQQAALNASQHSAHQLAQAGQAAEPVQRVRLPGGGGRGRPAHRKRRGRRLELEVLQGIGLFAQ
jgi:hypothetical protein